MAITRVLDHSNGRDPGRDLTRPAGPRHSRVLPLLLLLLLGSGPAACSRSAPADWVELQPGAVELHEVGDWQADPSSSAAAVARCPRLSAARVLPGSTRMTMVELRGRPLSAVQRAEVRLESGTRATSRCQRGPPERLRCPVACSDCRLELIVALDDGREARCTGPGWSLQLTHGRILPPP